MGNRANYILKKDNEFDIYYTHWRAINVAQDLTLGVKRFSKLVKEFDKVDEILSEPWIEACVLLDFDSKKLTFWETEILFKTSIREEYISKLVNIWTNWTIRFAEKEMFEIEKELDIKYTSKQKIDLEFGSLEKLSDFSENDEYFSCLVILKENSECNVKYINGGQEEEITLIGEPIIEKLRQMKNQEFKKENSDDFFSFLIIDIDTKTLWINQSINGLEKELNSLWKDWNVNVGNFGYIKLLKKIGVNTTDLELKSSEKKEIVEKEIFNNKDDFDPNELAEKITENIGNDVKFNEYFFQNVKPKKSIWDKLKRIFN
jgi:hypothetical protein